VNDPLGVSVCHRVGHRLDMRKQREPVVQGCCPVDGVRQRGAGHERHRVARLARRAQAGVVDGNDGRMAQPRGDEGLAHEARHALRRTRRQRLLESHPSTQQAIVHLEDRSDAAAAALAGHLEASLVDDGQVGHGLVDGQWPAQGRKRHRHLARFGDSRSFHRDAPQQTPTAERLQAQPCRGAHPMTSQLASRPSAPPRPLGAGRTRIPLHGSDVSPTSARPPLGVMPQ
jgi:hypothetical protein